MVDNIKIGGKETTCVGTDRFHLAP